LHKHEDPVRHVYLDMEGDVTTGVGYLIPSDAAAAALQLFWPGAPASPGVPSGRLRPASDEPKRRACHAVKAKRD